MVVRRKRASVSNSFRDILPHHLFTNGLTNTTHRNTPREVEIIKNKEYTVKNNSETTCRTAQQYTSKVAKKLLAQFVAEF